MNKSPMNFLITTVLGLVLWIITAVALGPVLGDRITLISMPVEDFIVDYRIDLAIATFFGILITLFWFYYGGKDSTAGELDRAKKIWNISFVAEILFCAVLVFALVFITMTQGVSLIHYIFIFVITSLHTFVFFWVCTLLMSPVNVERIPLGKR